MGAFRLFRMLLTAAFYIAGAGASSASDAVAALARAPDGPANFLKTLPREWSGTSARDCRTYEDKNIERLSRTFSASAANFLRAFVEVHGNVTITSAHRTALEQACVCDGEKGPCAGKPRIIRGRKGRIVIKKSGISRHQLGIALDVRAGTGSDEEFACLHEFAQLNPQFGVWFPHGKRDRPHMEPKAGGSTNVKLAALGSMPRPVNPCTNMKTMLRSDPLD